MTTTRRNGPMTAVSVLLLAAGLSAGPAKADATVAALVGSWSGNAQAVLDNGKTEQMRCKGYYTGQGSDGLGIAIRCANASSKIDLRAHLTFANGQVSGDWEERTYNAQGSVSGRASANKVNLAIVGGGLKAAMSVAISGSSHAVSISTQGTGLKGVNITFSRG